MKNIPAPLATHIALEVTTLCTCWKIIRQDGEVFGFTDHDVDLTVDGLDYESETGYNRTAIANESSFAVDNLDVSGILDSEKISDEELRNGLFDFAKVFIFMVNWADPEQGIIKLRRGWFGEVQQGRNGIFETEIRGLNQALSHNFMESYSPECRADFCDERCKLILADYTQSGEVEVATASRITFKLATGLTVPSDNFLGGQLKFTSGDNTGNVKEIVSYNSTTRMVEMFEGFPYAIQAGDEFEISQGCPKTFTACKAFNNETNFRGEPHVPGNDEMMRYPDVPSS